MNSKPFITVLSPVYNKSKTIRRTFESLINQTCYYFEWLLINDGSTDDSFDIINSFKTDNFKITIINKKNEGLNRTFNKGVKLAKGDYILRLDPDDIIISNAIETIIEDIPLYCNDNTLCGLVYLTKYSNNKIVGTHPYNDVHRSNFIDYRIIDKALGDRCEIVKTEILKKYTMPEIEGEKFCRESYMWFNIALCYEAIYIPKAIYIREYDENSISSNAVRTYSKNPKGMMMGFSLIVKILTSNKKYHNVMKDILRAGINYFRFGLYSKMSFREIFKGLPLSVSCVCFIPGFLFFIIDHLNPKIINTIVRNHK